MTRSRQADDPNRFQLQMTDEGPRFVLGSSAEGPARLDTVVAPPTMGAASAAASRPQLDLTAGPRKKPKRPAVTDKVKKAPVDPAPEAGVEAAPMANAVKAEPAAAVESPKAAPKDAPRPELARVRKVDAPTETQTVLDATNAERLPNAFWKATLPPSADPAPVAVAADYTVEAGVERVHAPVASPEEAAGLLHQAEEAAAHPTPSPRRASKVVDLLVAAGRVRVSSGLMAVVVLLALGAGVALQVWPQPTAEDVVVARADGNASGKARLAQSHTSRLFARGLDGALQKSLDSGLYVVVGRNEDGTMSNETIVEDMMTRDLESAQKLARIKSEALAQPLFIIARRNGEVSIVDRVNPGDRAAWRDYTMNVWYLKQHALAWSRERYMSREALDAKRTVAVMSDFVRSHPDSRVVGPALEDMRYVCYYTLQDPGKFRVVALALLDETLQSYDRHRTASVPELVYVMKPYLKEAMNQLLYQRIHRLTMEQTSLHPTSTDVEAALAAPRHM